MVQISKKQLDKNLEREMFTQFWNSLAKIRNPNTAAEFFSDLLSDTERVMLAKRFTVAILLIRGKSATDITKTINVTYSTVGSVASWVKNAKPKTRRVLLSLSKEKDWENLLDKIESLLDKLPPEYYSDWKRAGKEKWKRAIKRSARRNLR